MAISHVQPLLLLLTSLFFLPVYCVDVPFEYCNKTGYDFGKVYRVVTSRFSSQDYYLDILVIAHSKERIYKGLIEVYAESKDYYYVVKKIYICELTESCAIEAGIDFQLPLNKVPKVILRDDTKYGVSLLDEEFTEKLCVKFSLRSSDLTLVSPKPS